LAAVQPSRQPFQAVLRHSFLSSSLQANKGIPYAQQEDEIKMLSHCIHTLLQLRRLGSAHRGGTPAEDRTADSEFKILREARRAFPGIFSLFWKNVLRQYLFSTAQPLKAQPVMSIPLQKKQLNTVSGSAGLIYSILLLDLLHNLSAGKRIQRPVSAPCAVSYKACSAERKAC
jgi:hypothetical protein